MHWFCLEYDHSFDGGRQRGAEQAMEEAYRYLQDPRTPEWTGTDADGSCGAREMERRATPIMERQLSEALDTGQLAFYLCFREIPKWAITDAGMHIYFLQYDTTDMASRNTIFAQLEQEAASRDMAGVLELFKFMLDGDFREQFYEEVYSLVARTVQNARRPTALADLLRVASEADDDAREDDLARASEAQAAVFQDN